MHSGKFSPRPLTAFREISAEAAGGRYAVLFQGEKIPVYSDRSAARDLAQIKELIAAVPAGHTALLIAPYADSLRVLLDTPQKFFWISPVHFAPELPGDERLVADDAGLERFINNVGADEKFTLLPIAQWQQASAYVVQATRALLERAAVRLKTIGHFARLWQINFRVNAAAAARYGDIAELRGQKPDALVMAGPSLDTADLTDYKAIWCADTALPALIARGTYPQVVFSVDAGFASREHFVDAIPAIRSHQMRLVCDLLGYPAVQRLPFAGHLTYASSHPLVQEFSAVVRPDLTPIENPAGDVGSLMRAVFQKFFGNAAVKISGHDGGHRRRITHARGTAYFRRSFAAQTRLVNVETYMLKLSRRYG
jgi:hypothetical protein